MGIVRFREMNSAEYLADAFGYELFIDENYRGQGIGRQVMAPVQELLKEKGVRRLKLCVFDGNSRARALYARLGFKETGFREKSLQREMEIEI